MSVEMDALNRYCGISKRNRIRTEVVKRAKKTSETVEEEIKRKQHLVFACEGNGEGQNTKNGYSVLADL